MERKRKAKGEEGSEDPGQQKELSGIFLSIGASAEREAQPRGAPGRARKGGASWFEPAHPGAKFSGAKNRGVGARALDPLIGGGARPTDREGGVAGRTTFSWKGFWMPTSRPKSLLGGGQWWGEAGGECTAIRARGPVGRGALAAAVSRGFGR